MSIKDENEKKLPPVSEQKSESKSIRIKIPKLNKKNRTLVEIILILVMGAITISLFRGAIKTGASALLDSFNTEFQDEREAASSSVYQYYYDKAKEKYLVKNQVSISIENIRETASLEVLKVSDTEYIIDNAEDTGNGITSWLEVPGNGTYTVNLQAAEFVVDDERDYVLVRVPYPEITNISLDYSNVKKLFFHNDIFSNESDADGENLAKSQLDAAESLIRKEFASNQRFYQNAQDAAVISIQNLVRRLNPDVQNLTVDVEFY